MNEIIKASSNGKIEKKAVDYRLSLVHVVGYLMKNDPRSKVLTLFKSLLNIQHLLYMSYERRNNETILSFHLRLFRHIIAIKDIVGSTLLNFMVSIFMPLQDYC